jgi:hypothetical protein
MMIRQIFLMKLNVEHRMTRRRGFTRIPFGDLEKNIQFFMPAFLLLSFSIFDNSNFAWQIKKPAGILQ